jgi:hypothetical protein
MNPAQPRQNTNVREVLSHERIIRGLVDTHDDDVSLVHKIASGLMAPEEGL